MNWQDNIEWANSLLERIEAKYSKIVERTKVDFFPYTVKDNHMVAYESDDNYDWWTNGFYPGILWELHLQSGKTKYQALAEHYEELLDRPLHSYEGLHHDVGFMWLTSAVASYRITGNKQSKNRGLLAASVLASRYNIEGNFIRAWNGDGNTGWAIIDSMMNLPILYWASEETKDPRFAYIAKRHADKVMENFIREDGSVRHIVSFDIKDGHMIEEFGGQGYSVGSAWTRGQAWAIYGFVLNYLHTKDERYLMTSKRVAHFFLTNMSVEKDGVPPCDFRSPKDPIYKDTTAGSIAACGLLEISKVVPEYEKGIYLEGAIRILKGIETNFCNLSFDTDSLVEYGTERYGKGTNIPIIYGDYYFIEALMKIKGNDILFW
ncbi:MAG TPA: glycosyl hydrolase family 88 [Lachnoclostridium phytofermentans]|uniref:Glycosyl hydrolase family 88 n=1 Tax=Lachnoclostridium phytofermentans TaxID=66219 RepID=A0A3D2X3P2_9FIRM|nr:glycoside hydrolase family 88 protein [Lachnoclostridium sp.]HCL01769.1 glycosyl hydrolase family 88 [Lachnoclostridium phytofermentans]